MIITERKIKCSQKERNEICEKLGIKMASLYNALAYKTHSKQAIAARKYAMDVFGHKPLKHEISI